MRSYLANLFKKKMEVLTYTDHFRSLWNMLCFSLLAILTWTSDTRILYTSHMASQKTRRLCQLCRPFWGRTQPSIVFGSCRLRFHPPSHSKGVSDACRKLSGPHGLIHVRMLLQRGSAGGWPPLCQKTLVRGCQAILLAAVDAQIWGAQTKVFRCI